MPIAGPSPACLLSFRPAVRSNLPNSPAPSTAASEWSRSFAKTNRPTSSNGWRRPAKRCSASAMSKPAKRDAPSAEARKPGAHASPGPLPTMAKRSRIAILISGRGSNMAALVYASRADGCSYEVALVTGDKPGAHGLEVAEAEGVQVEELDAKSLGAAYWDRLQEILKSADVDLIALAGFMRIIPDEFLARWDGRIVNIHPSLLPKHKGLKTHEACLAAGDKVTGATVHLVTPELDSGDILGQVEVAVLASDSADTLAERVLIAEHQLYPHV